MVAMTSTRRHARLVLPGYDKRRRVVTSKRTGEWLVGLEFVTEIQRNAAGATFNSSILVCNVVAFAKTAVLTLSKDTSAQQG